MSRYIDADALLLKIDCHGTNKFGMLDEDIRDFVRKIPAADVAEVIHSDWHTSTVRMSSIDVTCRNCHRTEKISITNYFEYCPHCGAKMDGERKDEE